MEEEINKRPKKNSKEINQFFILEIKSLKQKIETQDNRNKKLKALLDVASIISSSLDKREVLKRILLQTKELMECDRSSVLLVDSTTNQLKFEVVTDEKEMEYLNEVCLNMGEGVAGKVWEYGRSILIKDVEKDIRFSQKADEKTKTTTTSLIASPLVVKGNIIGVMEAMNKLDGSSFTQFDTEIFENLAIHAAIAIENADLYKAGISDRMTDLFNHSHFKTRLYAEINRVKRYKLDLSLALFDIDNFKHFNDTYGHQLGDKVLKKVASIIQANSRDQVDIPCRYGGEEFAVILPETSKEGAIYFAERIRKAVETMQIDFEGEQLSVTISGGIATFPNIEIHNSNHMLKLADTALYFSKKNGRNQINYYELSMESSINNVDSDKKSSSPT